MSINGFRSTGSISYFLSIGIIKTVCRLSYQLHEYCFFYVAKLADSKEKEKDMQHKAQSATNYIEMNCHAFTARFIYNFICELNVNRSQYFKCFDADIVFNTMFGISQKLKEILPRSAYIQTYIFNELRKCAVIFIRIRLVLLFDSMKKIISFYRIFLYARAIFLFLNNCISVVKISFFFVSIILFTVLLAV